MEKKTKQNKRIDVVKAVMHAEYDHNIYVYHNRKRYMKEDIKKYKNKRDRKKAKQSLKKYI